MDPIIAMYRATENDIAAIQGLLYPHYFSESVYKNMTYSADNTRRIIESWLPNCAIIVKDGDKAVGFASMVLQHSFFEEPEADVEMFFILPEYRGTGVARALCKFMIETAEANGAKLIFSSCLSGIDGKNNSLYINLWRKFGFEILGTVLVRSP